MDKWLECIAGLAPEVQDRIIADTIRTLAGKPALYCEDKVVEALVAMSIWFLEENKIFVSNKSVK